MNLRINSIEKSRYCKIAMVSMKHHLESYAKNKELYMKPLFLICLNEMMLVNERTTT